VPHIILLNRLLTFEASAEQQLQDVRASIKSELDRMARFEAAVAVNDSAQVCISLCVLCVFGVVAKTGGPGLNVRLYFCWEVLLKQGAPSRRRQKGCTVIIICLCVSVSCSIMSTI
jgi:Flp pilus assembly protein TadB